LPERLAPALGMKKEAIHWIVRLASTARANPVRTGILAGLMYRARGPVRDIRDNLQLLQLLHA